MKLEPLFFEPVYKNVIWGGEDIAKKLNRDVQGNDIGESWELSAHPNGISYLKNNKEKISLIDLFDNKEIKKQIFGTKCQNMKKFPILIQFIDAKQKLSIQVHPDDQYAEKYENDSGKSEAWYIMDCKKDAKIIYGLNENAEKEDINNVVENIKEYINYQSIEKGDFIPISAGTVHAILDGTLICEIQQSSDVTYRVYDWDRIGKDGKPRQLHKEKAIDVINTRNESNIFKCNNITKQDENIYKSNIFCVDMVNIKNNTSFISNKESFTTYIVIDGEGKIKSEGLTYDLVKGNTFVIPAELGKYELSGDLKLLKVYI